MRFLRIFVTVCFVTVCMSLVLPTVQNSFGESGLRKYERGGLSFHYPFDLKSLNASSTEKIRQMLNANMKGMGNTQSSVIALDVLLHLPAFRVLISKERFVADPTPPYLIKDKKYFLDEGKKQGGIISYGTIQEKKIAGYPTIEFKDINKGAQGYGTNVTILCGRDTWNFAFTGSNQKNHEMYRDHMNQIVNSIEILGTCEKTNTVLS